MSQITIRTVLHKRFSNFTTWIKPDPDMREDIKKRADNIRKKIRQKAEEEGLTIQSTPYAGSFPTRTGLRRHFRGNAEVEGQDIDIPFVVSPTDEDGKKLNYLLEKFKGFANSAYPDTTVEATKSSIKLKFGDKVNFDIVPMLATDDPEAQLIVRSTGEKIQTSVQKHVQFIRSRNKLSNDIKGRVTFNECIRLLKWWRDIQSANSYYLGKDNCPPSFLINLLAAKAFDKLSVEETYAETLFKWCGYLAHLIESKEAILFQDYNSPNKDLTSMWTVMDPVNDKNNVVRSWDTSKIKELAEWFAKARDEFSRMVHYDEDGDDTKALESAVKLFGTPFKNHCDN